MTIDGKYRIPVTSDILGSADNYKLARKDKNITYQDKNKT